MSLTVVSNHGHRFKSSLLTGINSAAGRASAKGCALALDQSGGVVRRVKTRDLRVKDKMNSFIERRRAATVLAAGQVYLTAIE